MYMHLQHYSWILLGHVIILCLFAVNMDYYIHCFIHQFCLQLVTTSYGFAANSSYCNIINYQDNVVRISQNIVIILFLLSHRPTKHINKQPCILQSRIFSRTEYAKLANWFNILQINYCGL